MFACNQGGHFSQMMAMKELFSKYDSVLVTDNVRASKEMSALKDIGEIEFMLANAESRKRQKSNRSNRIFGIKAYLKAFCLCIKIWKKY